MAARGTVPEPALAKQARADQHIGGGDMRAAMSALHSALAEARKVPPCAETEAFKVSCMCKLAECAKRMNVSGGAALPSCRHVRVYSGLDLGVTDVCVATCGY